VHIASFNGSNENYAKRFKLFNEDTLRKVVINRIVMRLRALGLVNKNQKTKLCLVAGNIDKRTKVEVMKFFKEQDWLIFDDEWLRKELTELSNSGMRILPLLMLLNCC
jgi:hypothetical protein